MMRLFNFTLLLLVSVATVSAEAPQIDLKAVDAVLANVGMHARNYPPRFANDEQRQKAEALLRETIAQLDAALVGQPDNHDLLRRAGVANSLGHNLDFPKAAKRCAEVFDHLLALYPDDGRSHLHYGIFLAGSGRPKEGLPHLERALALGAREANFAFAITYLTMENKEMAIAHLKQFIVDFPRDAQAKKLLDALESEPTKFVKKVLAPGEMPPPVSSEQP